MSLLLNSAGGSSGDPILSGLGFEWVVMASSMDVATFTNAWIDTANNSFPGSNAVTPSPATSNVYHGNDMTSDNAGLFTASSAHGLVVGDYIYLSHASITAGVYKVATVPLTTTFTVSNGPSNTTRTGISFEVAWRYTGTYGTAPSVAGAFGSAQINYYKATLADSAGNATNQLDSNYVSAAPAISSTAFVSIDSKAADGTATTKQTAPAFNLLSGWTNHGGVTYVQLTTSSAVGHTSAQDFLWWDGTRGEKTLANAIANGMTLTAGDGAKYGGLQMKSLASAAVVVTQNIQITLDTTAPTIAFAMYGR